MNLVKSTGTFGFYTIISRLLGYLRDVLIAIFLGTSFLADAFFVAFRIPNTFRRLFAEGTFNAAFVPSYTAELVKNNSKSTKFANQIFNLLFLGLFFLVLVVELFMPAFVSLIAPGFVENKEKIEKKSCGKKIIAGVAVETNAFRYYPKKDTLAPLLGKTNTDNSGVFGIEAEYDQYLAGINGIKKITDSKSNSNIYYENEVIKEFKNGLDINLTIDSDIQFHVFNAIKEQAEFHEADAASAIVLSPNGEILALANYPSTNPNDQQKYSADDYRNRVFSDKTEPGSTMKPFTMLLALDKGVISASNDELIDVTERVGNIMPDDKYFEMTIKLILEKSHNLGTVKVAERLENEDFYNSWEKLGFGKSLGLMPSLENPGILRHHSKWGMKDKRSLSFGHGPMNTNLAQLARAYLVFANDGGLPSLKLIKDSKNEQIKQVFSPESTKKIAEILDSVASDNGSGYRAAIEGYDIAGKTGTAEMVIDGKYSKDGAKRTYFVGFSPVINPKYIMAVRLDYPKKCFVSWDPTLRNRCEGSNSAAMAFKRAMERILVNDPEIEPKLEG